MKRQMLLVTGDNHMVNTDLDALTHLVADEWDFTYFDGDMETVGDFDAVMLSMTHGLPSTYHLATLLAAVKPGRAFAKEVDIQYGHQRLAAWSKTPLTAIATLAPSIAGTSADREMRRRWMRRFHPDSRIAYSEFLAGLVYTVGPDIEAAAKRAEKTSDAHDVNRFYWGIARPGVTESLKSMGLGASKRDAVFGKVAKQFRGVRDLSAGLTPEQLFDVDTWAPMAHHADEVLLPYEPIKSEYQITRRLLECAYLSPGRTTADPRISEHVQRFLDVDEWHAYAKQVSAELLEILDEGLPVKSTKSNAATRTDWSEYGPKVGSNHGELLRWVLDTEQHGEGWAVEFGTGDGTSARALSQHMRVMTFDCLTGLPETWRPGFGRGAFAQRHIPKVSGSIFVNGLFADTLPGAPLPEKVAILHVDCDLYSSTATIFERARDLIQVGTVVVFDELIAYEGWEDHEHKAWTELLAAWPTLKVEAIGHAHEAVAYRVLEV